MPSTRSGDPRKRAAAKKTTRKTDAPNPPPAEQNTPEPDSRYAPTTWGSGLGTAEDLEMPSGQLALVKRPGMQGLIEAGLLSDLDSLTAIVGAEHIDRVKKGATPQVNAESLANDPDGLMRVMHLVDRVVCHVVVQPRLVMVPNDITSRKRDVIYTDMVDVTDKMFIFNYALGGTRSVERFRQESQAALGSMDDGQGLQVYAS